MAYIKKNSYTEAYTEFLDYYASKRGVSMDLLVPTFSSNGIEKRFRELYNQNPLYTNEQYRTILGLEVTNRK